MIYKLLAIIGGLYFSYTLCMFVLRSSKFFSTKDSNSFTKNEILKWSLIYCVLIILYFSFMGIFYGLENLPFWFFKYTEVLICTIIPSIIIFSYAHLRDDIKKNPIVRFCYVTTIIIAFIVAVLIIFGYKFFIIVPGIALLFLLYAMLGELKFSKLWMGLVYCSYGSLSVFAIITFHEELESLPTGSIMIIGLLVTGIGSILYGIGLLISISRSE